MKNAEAAATSGDLKSERKIAKIAGPTSRGLTSGTLNLALLPNRATRHIAPASFERRNERCAARAAQGSEDAQKTAAQARHLLVSAVGISLVLRVVLAQIRSR